uniref:Eukaryotic translation initiation factor 3 subunit G n=1 Tax=Setaria digitata TaxID=48799 RepID=A0A915PTE3_9BILA
MPLNKFFGEMAGTAPGSAPPLPNLSSISAIGSWAEAVEQETLSGEHESTKDGIKVVTDIISDDTGKYKVVTTFKLVTKKVPRPIAERKKWKKFGQCKNDGPGPHVSTTYVAEEVLMQFIRNRAGEQQLDIGDEGAKVTATTGGSFTHCRYCKSDEHWSVSCPYKSMYAKDDEEDLDSKEKDIKLGPTVSGSGKYVAPGMRGDRPAIAGGAERRSEENTCRVTNLPEECDEMELRGLFGTVGTVNRVFIAKDKHTNKPKGFAFVTFEHRSQTEAAIQKLNGYKLDHLVLKVEWTRIPEMGLLTILKKQRLKEKELRILVLGLDNGGKTTVLKRLNGEEISEVTPTFGFNIKTLKYKDMKLNMWDVGGQKSLRSYWRNYFEQTDGVMWVVDSADIDRMDDCKRELGLLLVEERLAGASLLVLANKQDLSSSASSEEIEELLGLRNLKSHHWNIFGCSAFTGENLVEAIDWLCSDISSRLFTFD